MCGTRFFQDVVSGPSAPGAVDTSEMPPGMEEKIAAAKKADELAGISKIRVTNDVAEKLEGVKPNKK